MVQYAVIDLDGTVYRGSELVPGTRDTVATLRDQGISVMFLTNNATVSRDEYSAKLDELGIPAEPSDILSSGVITASYLEAEHADKSWFVIGEDPFRTMLQKRGLNQPATPEQADGVVLALDRDFDYETLTGAVRAFDAGDPCYIATNSDQTRPGKRHPLPSTGALIGAVAGATGRRPDRILGKPSPTAAEILEDEHGINLGQSVLVGDRLETDIRFGESAGMETALVLSGVTDEADVSGAADQPDHILESIADLPGVVGGR